jgi:phthiocerol/phenolphthiocerol synthesis type-I polyketide synthase D
MTATASGSLDAPAIREWLLHKFANILDVPPADLDVHASLSDYGLDSRQLVELTVDLEALLGRRLPSTFAWDNPTIDALARACAAQQPDPPRTL